MRHMIVRTDTGTRRADLLGRLSRGAVTARAVVLAYASAPNVLGAQKTSPPDAETVWLPWLLILAFATLCCAVAFKNPKRSHMT